jgi:hypothetical protein
MKPKRRPIIRPTSRPDPGPRRSVVVELLVWLVAPLLVAAVVYLSLWFDYTRSEAQTQPVPPTLARQLGGLPPAASTMITTAFLDIQNDPRLSAAGLTRLVMLERSAWSTFRPLVHAAFPHRWEGVFTFAVGPRRAGCAVVWFRRPLLELAYRSTAPAACMAAIARKRG